MNDVLNTIKSRRSVRAYKSDLLKKEELQTIVEAGIYAPTGCNDQPWYFSVVQDRTLLDEVNEKTKQAMTKVPYEWMNKIGQNPNTDITHKAPVLIVVSMRKQNISGAVDCTAAMENMMLAAQSIGIGSCWMGFVNLVFGDAELMKKLGVPEGFEPQQAAVFGYKAKEQIAVPERNRDVVTYVGSY
jgi:nitroreductase